MRIVGPGVFGPPTDRPAMLALLRRVGELGINFIDTADMYGPFESEELIAEALHPYANGLVIGTKGGAVSFGPPPAGVLLDGTPQHLRDALHGSWRRLKLERLDLYQLHHAPNMLLIPGTTSLAHLEENVRAASLQLTAQDMRELDAHR